MIDILMVNIYINHLILIYYMMMDIVLYGTKFMIIKDFSTGNIPRKPS